jgi:very-short-patch-repair endonuclease
MREPVVTTRRSRQLRREMSLPEVLLWTRLRRPADPSVKFRRQHPRGPYVLDFFCRAAALNVEIDGERHAGEAAVRADASRDAWLAGAGVRVLRIAAAVVLADPDQVAAWVVEEARGIRTPLTDAHEARQRGEAL